MFWILICIFGVVASQKKNNSTRAIYGRVQTGFCAGKISHRNLKWWCKSEIVWLSERTIVFARPKGKKKLALIKLWTDSVNGCRPAGHFFVSSNLRSSVHSFYQLSYSGREQNERWYSWIVNRANSHGVTRIVVDILLNSVHVCWTFMTYC